MLHRLRGLCLILAFQSRCSTTSPHQLIRTEIIDETDRFVDNLRTYPVRPNILLERLPSKLRRLYSYAMMHIATSGPDDSLASRANLESKKSK